MRREQSAPRPDWARRVESVGLDFHTGADGTRYWDESACYVLSLAEVETIEAAAAELHQRCLDAVDHVVRRARWDELAIPPAAIPLIERSWKAREPSLYGRFDLAWDGRGAPRLLEYNADTPTSLVEAAVAQWYWLEDVHPGGDQFNSLHERLVGAWRDVAAWHRAARVHLASADDPEDLATVTYLRDTAEQAGLATEQLLVEEIGWNAARDAFVDLAEADVALAFKLYPWEWMAREQFADHLRVGRTRWLEPAWKMVLSNKGILAILWELFPNHPNLLPAYFDDALLEAYARKPLLSREGANVSLVMFGQTVAESGGEYGDEGFVYQALAPLPEFDGRRPVLGAWIVAGEPAGLGIRESDGPITGNTSRFVPHRIG
jgi:glutathionylspermidine synthase